MSVDHDADVAAWFAETERSLPPRPLSASVVEMLRASQRRSRGVVIALTLLVVAFGWLNRSVLIGSAGAVFHVTYESLEVAGSFLASPVAWILALVLGAAFWHLLHARD